MAAELVPAVRPQAIRSEVLGFIGGDVPPFPFLVGRRGYFGDSLGVIGANDVGLYDDAMWLVERDTITAWNANCDPGRHQRGMATLKVGRWKYRPGTHGLSRPKAQQYEALVQAGHVTVARDEQGDETGFFGINIHRGGFGSVSSLGCQTIPPAQWGSLVALERKPDDFMPTIHRALIAEGRDWLWYVLTSRYE